MVRLREMLDHAYSAGYAVPAFNVFDDMSMDAVLMSAARQRSPVVAQVSVRTASFWGPRVVQAGFAAKAHKYGATAILHLDHCREPDFLLACLDSGWDSALFDASYLSYSDSVLTTMRVVELAGRRGADIEGEFEQITRAGATVSSHGPRPATRIEDCVRFVESTGVSCFSPALGTQHGIHQVDPVIDYGRARRLAQVAPVVLHGGSGLSDACLRSVISSGVSKINFSSILKERYSAVIRTSGRESRSEPLELIREIHGQLCELCRRYTELMGSAGRAP